MNASPSPYVLIQPTRHICSCPAVPIFRRSGHFCLMNSMRMPIAFMFFCHSSSRSRSRAGRRRRHRQRQRLAVRQLAPAVAVAVDVAELVEQRLRRRGVVRRRDVRACRRGRARPAESAAWRRAPGPGSTTWISSSRVEAHDDRAAQRDLVRRVAADDRILHVEVRVRQRRLRDARCSVTPCVAYSGLSRFAASSTCRDEIGRHVDVIELAAVECEQLRIRFLDDRDLDAADDAAAACPSSSRRARGRPARRFGKALVAVIRIRLEHDLLAAPPRLEHDTGRCRPGLAIAQPLASP